MKNVIGALILCLVGIPAINAQEVVGRSVVHGQLAELLSDNTWQVSLAPSGAANCSAIDIGVEFCGSSEKFKVHQAPAPDVDLFYFIDDRNYAMPIVEGIGTALGMEEAVMTTAILKNAAAGASIDPSEVTVFENVETEISGLPARQMIYSVKFNSLPFVFYNTHYLGADRSMQAITYALGTEITDAAVALHQEFLAGVRLE